MVVKRVDEVAVHAKVDVGQDVGADVKISRAAVLVYVAQSVVICNKRELVIVPAISTVCYVVKSC